MRRDARCTGPTPSTSRVSLPAHEALEGTHDFTAFTPTETHHVRFSRDVLVARWTESGGGMLEFWIEADSFMRHMNRVLVGTMLEVASGRRSVADFAALLAGAPRSEAGVTAPALRPVLRGGGLRRRAGARGEAHIRAGHAAIVCRTTSGNKSAAFLDECSIWK